MAVGGLEEIEEAREHERVLHGQAVLAARLLGGGLTEEGGYRVRLWVPLSTD